MTMAILEAVRRCKHCGRDMTHSVSVSSYCQNPFCDECFDERVAEAASRGPVARVLVNGYMQLIPLRQKPA